MAGLFAAASLDLQPLLEELERLLQPVCSCAMLAQVCHAWKLAMAHRRADQVILRVRGISPNIDALWRGTTCNSSGWTSQAAT